MPIVVCIDTNVFVRETHLLRKKGGPPLIHSLRAVSGRFFIPEILRLEYLEQSVAAVGDERNKIISGFDRIQTLVGERDDFRVPTDEQTLAATESRLGELASLTAGLSLTDEILAAAGRRVISKKPPTSKTDHGYKDCLIWESILRLEPGSDVYLISKDSNAFLTDGSLSPVLQSEAAEIGLRVIASPRLEDVLEELQKDGAPGFDFARATRALHRALTGTRERLTTQWALSSLSSGLHGDFARFYTENVSRIYVTFSLRYNAGSAVINGIEHSGPNTVELIGTYSWYPSEDKIADLQIEAERLIVADGSLAAQNRTIYAQTAHLSTGRRSIPYQIKGPLHL